MNFPGIKIGLTRTVSHTVEQRDTARSVLPHDVEPLLSPSGLVALVGEAATAIVDPLLPDGFVSVAKSFSVTHEHPSVIGASLAMTVSVTGFDGHHITFDIVAADELGVVATGTHVRSIANHRWLRMRIAARAGELAQARSRS